MRYYLDIYTSFVSQKLKTLLEYRFDFFMGTLGFFVIQSGGVVFLAVLFQNIPSLNGWTFEQILFIYGFSQFTKGIDHLLTDNLWALSMTMVKNGDLDRYLVRPLPPLFHLIAENIQFDAFGEILISTLLIITAVIRMPLVMPWYNWVFMALIIPFGVLIYASVKLFFGSLAFWLKESGNFLNLAYSFSEFGKYPVKIYSPLIRGLISFIVPYAFTAFYPAGYLIGKISWMEGLLGTALVSLVFAGVAYLVWRMGLRFYESAGN